MAISSDRTTEASAAVRRFARFFSTWCVGEAAADDTADVLTDGVQSGSSTIALLLLLLSAAVLAAVVGIDCSGSAELKISTKISRIAEIAIRLHTKEFRNGFS